MKPSEQNVERLWAYVHGETDAETRETLAAAIASDPAMAAAEQEIRALHGRLKQGLSADGLSDEDLCSEITAAWDREHEQLRVLPDTDADETARDTATRTSRFTIWHSGLAIAACLLIMMGVQTLRPPAALTWNAGRFVDEDAWFRKARARG